MVSLFAVIPEYDHGPDIPGIWLVDTRAEAIEEATSRQQEANRECVPVLLRVYELTEVTR